MIRLTLLGMLVLSACRGEALEALTARPDASGSDPAARRVEVVEVRPTDARLTLELPGEVEGAQDALLASPVGGRVEEVRVREGQDVGRGEVLVVIDRELHAAQVDQAGANLRQAKDDVERLEVLGEYATAAELRAARTRVEVGEANLRLARAQLDRAIVRAPFTGTVGSVAVSVGEMAGPGAALLRLVQLDPVRVTLSVSDRDVVALEVGTPARVRTHASSGGREGKVAHISPVGDLRTRAFVVEVEVANPGRDLLPGMIAKVEVERMVREGAVVLPQDWLVTRPEVYGVFVVEDGRARWRPVELGHVVRGDVIIDAGVEPGERVVVVGQHDLVDGDPVRVDRAGWCCRDGRAVFDAATAAR